MGSLCFTSQRKPRIIFLSSYSLHQPSFKVSTTLNAELLSNREKFSRKYHVFSSKLDCDRDFKSLYKLKRKRAKRFHLFLFPCNAAAAQNSMKLFISHFFLQHYVIWGGRSNGMLVLSPFYAKRHERKKLLHFWLMLSRVSLSGTVCNVMETSRIMRVLYHP